MKPEERKKRLEKLVERYYGKLAVLQAWEQHPNPPMAYIRKLKARLRTHKNELTYKGALDPDEC
jgi:hypothetical protein